ncbi:hypothetical protein [Streptomyces sp. NPDC058254]|uniref:hypothetical protein n=1 Tax=Streptomyces sp. NPDC058254 TaxID=3346406 RepID=UPI0036EEEAC9
MEFDLLEERQQVAGARSGVKSALLVVPEGPKYQRQIAGRVLLADFGEELGLGAAGPVDVLFRGQTSGMA